MSFVLPLPKISEKKGGGGCAFLGSVRLNRGIWYIWVFIYQDSSIKIAYPV